MVKIFKLYNIKPLFFLIVYIFFSSPNKLFKKKKLFFVCWVLKFVLDEGFVNNVFCLCVFWTCGLKRHLYIFIIILALGFHFLFLFFLFGMVNGKGKCN